MRWRRQSLSGCTCLLGCLLFALTSTQTERPIPTSTKKTPTSPYPASDLHPGPAWFIDVAQQAGLDMENVNGGADTKKFIIETTGSGVAILDYDNDGWPDIFLVNGTTMDQAQQGSPKPTSHLYHNNHDGTFSDVTQAAGLEFTGWGQGVCVGDYDNDGWPDIYITCDSTPSLYFHNKHDGTFEEMGLNSGLAVNEDGREQAGMGATTADYDGDGRLDIFKTNFSSDTNTLYRNVGNNTFDDVTSATGLAVHTQYVKWGTAFLDFDNDGWPDLFVTDGHVYPFVEKYNLGEEFKQPSQLFWNRGDGQFFDMSSTGGPGITAKHASRGIAVGDLDNDGSQEIVVVNLFEPPSLLKNFGARGNALLVRAVTASGRDAIGARLTLKVGERKEIDEVRSGGYHISQGDFRVHFGMGHATKADLTIRWPDGAVGKVETIPGVDANQWIVVREGRGIVERHAFTHDRP
jgi:hypothetical protein